MPSPSRITIKLHESRDTNNSIGNRSVKSFSIERPPPSIAISRFNALPGTNVFSRACVRKTKERERESFIKFQWLAVEWEKELCTVLVSSRRLLWTRHKNRGEGGRRRKKGGRKEKTKRRERKEKKKKKRRLWNCKGIDTWRTVWYMRSPRRPRIYVSYYRFFLPPFHLLPSRCRLASPWIPDTVVNRLSRRL